jgi:hypothetical protein
MVVRKPSIQALDFSFFDNVQILANARQQVLVMAHKQYATWECPDSFNQCFRRLEVQMIRS